MKQTLTGGSIMFVVRDMFMRFQGGAVGHKADEDIQMEDEGSVAEELNEEGGVEEDNKEDEDNEEDKDKDEEDEEDVEDHITAEYSEVLNDNILANEGYGAL
ncbi:hypothetical protein BDR04DRAFT_1116543 [Suillus decipiens]|nr:hypothetical protein BDR04DRAFT_1116543 [Suillus decipiens]